MNKITKKKIGQIILEDIEGTNIPIHFINEAFLKQSQLGDNRKLGEILVKDGLLSEETISEALAIQFGVEYVSYMSIKPRIQWRLFEKQIFKDSFPDIRDFIRKSSSFPAYIDEDNKIVLMITNPEKFDLDLFIVKLEKLFVPEKRTPQIEEKFPELKEYNGIRKVIVPNYAINDFELKLKSITVEELKFMANKITDASNEEDMLPGEITASEFLKYILIYSITEDASDIHLKPAANYFSRISVRKQGVLETLLYLPIKQMSKIVAAIKNQSKLDATNVKAPQDGRIDGKRFLNNIEFSIPEKQTRVFDFQDVTLRVSTYPTEAPYIIETGTSFESVVMRIFNPKSGLVRIEDLGLSKQVSEEIKILKDRAQGIILITGPTGSGKSTTLYSVLGSVDSISTNIITFEDPVELRQLFWAQGQKREVKDNPKMNFTYAEAIKSMMRQDPDVILLGEIREIEGATFAFQAANTGHMVFSTLHANSSAQAFERLRKIGIDSLTMSSSILAVSAQRLVRIVCPGCGEVGKIEETQKMALKKLEVPEDKIPEMVTFPHSQGCERCGYRKYIGRVLISEILPVYKKVREAIVNDEPDYVISDIANKMGYKTLLEDGLEKLQPKKIIKKLDDGTEEVIFKPGTTTINELLRVI